MRIDSRKLLNSDGMIGTKEFDKVTLGICALLLASCTSALLPYDLGKVPATAETTPMFGVGDRADDPALWVHPLNPSLSLILGTNKREGLFVYDLDGLLQQRINIGEVNNVDVRGDLAVLSNYGAGSLSWVRITATDNDATIQHIGDTALGRDAPYGVCLGIIDAQLVVGVTYTDGAIEIWGAVDRGEVIATELLRTVMLGDQLEGCAFDDAERRLFVGEEDHGVWSLDLADPTSSPQELDTIATGKGLAADVEGVSLYALQDGSGYLVVSAQSADRLVFYERQPPHQVVGAIRITSSRDGTVDKVSYTDGLEANSAPLPGYPRGLLIVQDDANPEVETDQNFKLVDWRDVEIALRLPAR